jgi:hypothetical protein
MFIFLCLLCIIPVCYQWKSFELYNNNQLKYNLSINNTVRAIIQCEHNSILSIDNLIFIFIAIILCFIFSFCIKREKHCINVCNGRPGSIYFLIELINKIKFVLGCLSPIEPFTIVNRYETAALCGIMVVEVLMTLEHFLIDLSELWKRGVLIQFLDRTLIPLWYR